MTTPSPTSTPRCLGIALWISLALPPCAAAPVIINFEDLSAGGWGSGASVFVTDQYASRGVTFNQPVGLDYSKGHFAIPGFAHSGTKAVVHCYAQEFCSVPIEAQFTQAQRRVKVWVGIDSRIEVGITVKLRGLNAAGAVVGEDTTFFPPSNTPQPMDEPLEVVATSASIVKAQVIGDAAGFATIYNIAVDDVEFDTQGPPPACAATQAPAVVLNQPANGTTQLKHFILEGTVTTQTPIQEATVTVTGPTSSYVSNVFSLVPPNGGKIGPLWFGPLFPGANSITLRARNCRGTGISLTRTVVSTPIDPSTRLELLGAIEVTQAVQDINNFVTLIADKRTVARAYLRSKGPTNTLNNVRARLYATRPDGTRPGGPLTVLSTNSITVGPGTNITSLRSSATSSLNFVLPPEWITEGRLHLEVTGIEVEGTPANLLCDECVNDGPFNQTRFVTFEDAPPLRVVLWSVPYVMNGVTHEPRATDFDHLRSWLRRAYPTSQLLMSSPERRLNAFSGTPGDDFDCDDVNARLYSMRTFCTSFFCFDTDDSRTRYYGLVSDAGDFMRGCARGIPSKVASGPAGPGSFGWDTDGTYADWYGGHELGHTYDREHPGFCGESHSDDDFPGTGGTIGGSDFGDFGFDVGDSSLGIPLAAYPSSIWRDMMTYCDNQWISEYTYEGILGYLRDLEGDGGGQGGAAGEGLMVLGRIELPGGQVRLDPFTLQAGLALSQRPKSSPWAIDLVDAGGKRIVRYPFTPLNDTEAGPEGARRASITEVVPWLDGTKRVVISKDNVEVAAREVSPNAPQVAMISPNGGEIVRGRSVTVRWQGADRDRADRLTYTLLYSASGGDTWHALRVGMTGTEEVIETSELAGSQTALFRILASDGINTTSDDSDGPFTVPGNRPVGKILSPASGDRFAQNEAVLLEGEAGDVEDGNVDARTLAWKSNQQGILGSGRAMSVSSLRPGRHTITLVATDSSGLTDSPSVDIEIVAAPPVANAGANQTVSVGATVALDGSQSTGAEKLSHEWVIVSKPARSSARIGSPRSARTSFVADRLGSYLVQLKVVDANGGVSLSHVEVTAAASRAFRRADVNGSGMLDVSDAVFLLDVLFRGGKAFPCRDAADANDDAEVDVSDAVFVLGFLFRGDRAPPAPYPGCGVDPTSDALDCVGEPGC